MRISPAQLRLPTHRWQTPFASMVLHSEGAERTADYERAWGHKSVQLPRADDDATPASPPTRRQRARRPHSEARSLAIPQLIQTCCLPASVLVPGFLFYSGGRTLPNYYSQLWPKCSTRSFYPSSCVIFPCALGMLGPFLLPSKCRAWAYMQYRISCRRLFYGFQPSGRGLCKKAAHNELLR